MCLLRRKGNLAGELARLFYIVILDERERSSYSL